MQQKHFTHEAFLTHVVSLDLLDYLCPVHKKEVLKVDAFRDLLNKTCQQTTGAMTKEGTPIVVEPGQLVTSVSELARAWDWHRDKVRDFVDALAERDVLTIDMHKKFMILSFPDLAERIARYAQKANQAGSADSNASHGGAGENMSQQTKCSSVTQNVKAVTDGSAVNAVESGIRHDYEKREEVKPAIATRGGYTQADLFGGTNNAGNHNVPVYTNKK